MFQDFAAPKWEGENPEKLKKSREDSLFAVAEANMAAEYAAAPDLETRHTKCHRSMKACAFMKAWDDGRRPKPSDFNHACLHCMTAKITHW